MTNERLTKEDLFAAMSAVAKAEPGPCFYGQHVLPPTALNESGWFLCASCGLRVQVHG